ncbi:plasmid recombination protein [Jannaschia donghaensis]|uniref:Plasmid recombination enzyme n=1 Tax=Jannaschia donghaensis TaxID=420998 RepID=A0A0M6YCL7_9RHOB|nr:plasmid recombination protein [Jannaschia donghaensis]CTQ48102.1 Plasmid recombination enzyme [Jannaschia donghaensis]
MLDQSQPECPVVCRFRGMSPSDLGGYEKHRIRKGGDLGHVDRSRSHKNRPLIGEDDWAARTVAMIDDMKAENFADELETLTKRRRMSQIKARMVEGPRDPWRATRHGPLREVILTANRDWFAVIEPDGDNNIDFEKRERAFEAKAVEWLRENFGDDVVHARADLDETTYHIHAIIVPKVQVDLNGTKRWMLQPSKHPLIKNYEAAQDSVGQHFASIGLVRGERRAAAVRTARQNGQVPPPYREHVRTVDWRKAKDTRIVETLRELNKRETVIEQSEDDLVAARQMMGQREDAVAKREAKIGKREQAAEAKTQEADTILAIGEGLAADDFQIEDADDAPRLMDAPAAPSGRLAKLKARIASSPGARSGALHVFSNALKALRKRAREEAKAEVAAETAEIRRADDTIVEIARTLPRVEREKIGKIRRSLSAAIMALKPRSDGSAVDPKKADPR